MRASFFTKSTMDSSLQRAKSARDFMSDFRVGVRLVLCGIHWLGVAVLVFSTATVVCCCLQQGIAKMPRPRRDLGTLVVEDTMTVVSSVLQTAGREEKVSLDPVVRSCGRILIFICSGVCVFVADGAPVPTASPVWKPQPTESADSLGNRDRSGVGHKRRDALPIRRLRESARVFVQQVRRLGVHPSRAHRPTSRHPLAQDRGSGTES